jgi:hypothetical protein
VRLRAHCRSSAASRPRRASQRPAASRRPALHAQGQRSRGPPPRAGQSAVGAMRAATVRHVRGRRRPPCAAPASWPARRARPARAAGPAVPRQVQAHRRRPRGTVTIRSQRHRGPGRLRAVREGHERDGWLRPRCDRGRPGATPRCGGYGRPVVREEDSHVGGGPRGCYTWGRRPARAGFDKVRAERRRSGTHAPGLARAGASGPAVCTITPSTTGPRARREVAAALPPRLAVTSSRDDTTGFS